MAFQRVAFSILVLVRSAWVCDAEGFLARTEEVFITKDDVERTLSAELSLVASSKLRSIKNELHQMFVALPKNEQGRLEPTVVRYALHRFFVYKHGWYMRGLEPVGGSWSASADSKIMKDRAPAYIQSLFEKRLHGHGLGLHELAVFAAVLSDLVYKEVSGELHKVFASLRLPTVGPVPRVWSQQAVKAYLLQYFAGVDLNISGTEHLNFVEQKLVEIYPDWPGTYMWVEDQRQAHDLILKPRRNPFVPSHGDTFEESVSLVQDLWQHFGSFQDLECKSLKGRLVEMEHQGTGRVRLSAFYAGGVSGDWTLSESVEYLRNLGVLDETDPTKPSVVISNYLTSQTNCLSASGFYSVCCSDECEVLLKRLERDIAAPHASPEKVVEMVSALPSDTVHAPRNLSTALLARLNQIAEVHQGNIPLHGRLFAQWMHHAYPRECPFPHVSGTTSPMTPDAWMAYHGVDNVEATLEVMKEHHSRLHAESLPDDDLALPWTEVEELVAGQSGHQTASSPFVSTLLRCGMAMAALVSFALPLLRASKVVAGDSSEAKREQMLV